MPTVDVMLARLASRIDPRTKAAQQVFNDSSAAIAVIATADQGGLVRLTTGSAHGMQTGFECYITAVGGTVEANNSLTNPVWAVTVLSPTTFTVPVAFANAWASGGTVTPAMIGSSRGAFEPAQILDIYNQARWATFAALRMKYGEDKRTLQREVGALHQSATLTFSGATPATAAKPAGYVDFITLHDGSGTIHLVGADRLQAILEGRPNYLQSASNRQVFEQGALLVHSATFVSGTTTLRYIGIADFTLTNVLSGSSSETFNNQHLTSILELAEYIAEEHGANEVASMANRLLGAK